MLPSTKRLSRSDFTAFLASKEVSTVFNNLGTLKQKKAEKPQFSVVISSKTEKRAVYRNKLRRRLYSLFEGYLKDRTVQCQYVLYCSKQATRLSFSEIKHLFYVLLQKNTK